MAGSLMRTNDGKRRNLSRAGRSSRSGVAADSMALLSYLLEFLTVAIRSWEPPLSRSTNR